MDMNMRMARRVVFHHRKWCLKEGTGGKQASKHGDADSFIIYYLCF